MMKLNGWKMVCAACVFCVAAVSSNSAQTFTSLMSFDQANGESPQSSLVQGPNGRFYGTTTGGGSTTLCPWTQGCGTVFEISAAGQVTTIYNFCSQSGCADGQDPSAVIVGPGGNLYGTTTDGGVTSFGTVFKITPSGNLITLHNFCTQNAGCSDGMNPETGLVVGANGNLYGTTISGGTNGAGTIFEITPAGVLTTIYNFCSLRNCSDGDFPSGLVLGGDGNFYGTAAGNNGSRTFGDVFRVTPAGKLTVLHRFCSESNCADGATPAGGLAQGPNGELYGTTYYGGANESSCYRGGGTVFEITRSGQLTTLYSFCSQSNCSDGEWPGAAPVLDAKGNLYGTTAYGGASLQCGAYGCGTAFKITRSGQFTSLYSFCSQTECSDGELPVASLVLATNGNLYGTTAFGGTDGDCTNTIDTGCGTVFVLSKAAKPFVQTLPGFGIVGAEVGILGNKLTGTTSVTFNGLSATFTVKSATMIFANVPIDATNGYVTVTTANGTLTTNVPFRVMQ